MRMLMHVTLPLEPFNSAVHDGTIGSKMQKIMDSIKPEAAYFTEQNGKRGAMLIVNLKDPADVPKFAEPWFLTFNAEVEFRVVMSAEDLSHAHLEVLGKKW